MSMLSDQVLDVSPGTTEDPRVLSPWWLWIAGSIVAICLVLGFWLLLRPAAPVAKPARGVTVADNAVTLAADTPMRRFIDIAEAHAQPGLPPLPCPGRITFDERRTSAIGTPLAGRIEEIKVRLGDVVVRDQHLLSVRSGALADVEHEIEEARSQVAVKRRIAERTRALVELHTAAMKDQLEAEADLHEAELAFDTALAHRESLRVSPTSLNEFWITAPQDGSVVELNVAPSAQVTTDREQPLLRIADLGEVLVVADVQERDAADLKAGDVVEVRAQGGTLVRSGTVEHVSSIVDPTRRTIEARIRVENGDGALRPNAYVEVAVPAASTPRIRVPTEAVLTDAHESVVLRQGSDGRLVRVPVTLGRERDGEIEILKGLEPGDRYVSKGAILVLNEISLAAE
jgi:cobalt-zinc-cadmium efflux system membrane fusion protein